MKNKLKFPVTIINLTPVLNRLAAVEGRLEAVHHTVVKLANEKRWIDVRGFAELHGLHPCTVRRAAARGELDVQRVGRRVLIRLSEPLQVSGRKDGAR